MSPPGLRISLFINGAPAPASLMESLDNIEATRTDTAPSGFQVAFTIERGATLTADYSLLSSGLLAVGNRIGVTCSVFGNPSVVIDGFITHQQMIAGAPTENARFLVTGEDVSVQMALYEYSLEYPFAPDVAIAAIVLSKWLVLGITPDIRPTPTAFVSFAYVPQQVGDDRAYLIRLAAQHGYVSSSVRGPSWVPTPPIGVPRRVTIPPSRP